MPNEQIIESLKIRQGFRSVVEFAAAIGVNPEYLGDVYGGIREANQKLVKIASSPLPCQTKYNKHLFHAL